MFNIDETVWLQFNDLPIIKGNDWLKKQKFTIFNRWKVIKLSHSLIVLANAHGRKFHEFLFETEHCKLWLDFQDKVKSSARQRLWNS